MNAAVLRIGPRVGVNPDPLRGWVNQSDIDVGRRPGTTTADAARLKELERENRELKRANEIRCLKRYHATRTPTQQAA